MLVVRGRFEFQRSQGAVSLSCPRCGGACAKRDPFAEDVKQKAMADDNEQCFNDWILNDEATEEQMAGEDNFAFAGESRVVRTHTLLTRSRRQLDVELRAEKEKAMDLLNKVLTNTRKLKKAFKAMAELNYAKRVVMKLNLDVGLTI